MTNNEAAKWIQIFIDEVNRDLIEELGLCLSEKTQKMMEAIEMGRDALKRMEERTETLACDCISRQAAIDEIKALYEWHDTVTEDRTIDHLKRLPSAQPERRPMLYRDRVMLAKNFEEWARENHVIDCLEAIICYLDIIGLIQPKRKADALDEIVRCKECKHGSPNGKYGCRVYHYRRYETHDMKPDDFCSRAERRTDD